MRFSSGNLRCRGAGQMFLWRISQRSQNLVGGAITILKNHGVRQLGLYEIPN